MDDTPDQANVLPIIILVPRIFISIVLTIVVIYRGREAQGTQAQGRQLASFYPYLSMAWRCLKIEEIGH